MADIAGERQAQPLMFIFGADFILAAERRFEHFADKCQGRDMRPYERFYGYPFREPRDHSHLWHHRPAAECRRRNLPGHDRRQHHLLARSTR